MFNKDATGENIDLALQKYCKTLTEDDVLIIWMSGHGINDEKVSNQIYFIPSDGGKENRKSWVSFSSLRGYLNNIKARQILLISDSCFSGGVSKSGEKAEDFAVHSYEYQMMQRVGRQAISSGGRNQKVTDFGRQGHSLFAYDFFAALKDNDRRAISTTELYCNFLRRYKHSDRQAPDIHDLTDAGHVDGEAIFFQRNAPDDQSRDFLAEADDLKSLLHEQELLRIRRQYIGVAATFLLSFIIMAVLTLVSYQKKSLEESETVYLAAAEDYINGNYLSSTRLSIMASEKRLPFAKVAPKAEQLLALSAQQLSLHKEIPEALSKYQEAAILSHDEKFAAFESDRHVVLVDLETQEIVKRVIFSKEIYQKGFLPQSNRFYVKGDEGLSIYDLADLPEGQSLFLKSSSEYVEFSDDESKILLRSPSKITQVLDSFSGDVLFETYRPESSRWDHFFIGNKHILVPGKGEKLQSQIFKIDDHNKEPITLEDFKEYPRPQFNANGIFIFSNQNHNMHY